MKQKGTVIETETEKGNSVRRAEAGRGMTMILETKADERGIEIEGEGENEFMFICYI